MSVCDRVGTLAGMTDALTAWVDEVLGEHSVIESLPATARKADKGQRVQKVADGEGRTWMLKQVGVAHEWRAETHAYRDWVPAIEGHAPTLLASDEELRALLLSLVPGRHPRATNARAHRKAGAVLRRLHAASAPREQPASDPDIAGQRLERLLAESREVLSPQEHAFVRDQGDRLAELPLEPRVPCHGDYRPHNWLIDGSGTLRVIDFGKSRWETAAWDLAKLYLRPWWRRPQFASAFLEGYGRGLRAEEAEFIQRRMAVDAVAHTAFGATRGSNRHVDFGRSRLAELMAGHQVVKQS